MTKDNTKCPRCGREIDAADNFCRHCGIPLKQPPGIAPAVVPAVAVGRPARPSASDNPWLVLIMLFCVLGPFALPMLWRGRAFSRRWKWIWTLVTIAITVLICWLLWYMVVKMIMEPLQQLRF